MFTFQLLLFITNISKTWECRCELTQASKLGGQHDPMNVFKYCWSDILIDCQIIEYSNGSLQTMFRTCFTFHCIVLYVDHDRAMNILHCIPFCCNSLLSTRLMKSNKRCAYFYRLWKIMGYRRHMEDHVSSLHVSSWGKQRESVLCRQYNTLFLPQLALASPNWLGSAELFKFLHEQ